MVNKIAAARRVSKMTVERTAELAKVTPQTIVARDKDPSQWRLCELEGVYGGLDEFGKKIFKEGLDDIFLP